MTGFEVERLGEEALLLRLGDTVDADVNRRVHALAAAIQARRPPWLRDIVPAYASLALFVTDEDAGDDPLRRAERWLQAQPFEHRGQSRLPQDSGSRSGDASGGVDADTGVRPVIEIPVVYGGAHGPDLEAVAAHAGLSADEVVARHTAAEYRVAMLGFAPGFPYLLGLDPALAMPRMETPRTRIPAGSVAIGGVQTGIYPRESPGGWRIVGRTPLTLFDPARPAPALLAPGGRVRFVAVDAAKHRGRSRLSADSGSGSGSVSGTAGSGHDVRGPTSIEVLSPGLATTVQDAGRAGLRHLGVGGAGALDAYSHAVANLLVGNPTGAAVLEIALSGPRLRFRAPVRIALCGADLEAEADGIVVPGWRPVLLPAGATLALGRCRGGARACLAVAGGIAVPEVLGSASTDLRGGFGGLHGRALAAGDVLDLANPLPHDIDAPWIAPWWIDAAPDLDFSVPAHIRVLPGRDGTVPGDALFAREWRVAAASNRQGLRLEGGSLALAQTGDRISEPVSPGTLQLPPDGRPIVLLADAQTHGGYPRIGHAIRADRPRLAQLRPGDALRFAPCTPAQARAAACEQRQRLHRIALAIQSRRAAHA